MTSTVRPTQAGGVKSARRTLEVLEALAEQPPSMSLGSLQRTLGVPKSSLYNLLQTLVAYGWLETDASKTRYRLGVHALLVGAAYLDRDPVVRAANPLLAGLREELDETVHLARLDGGDIVYLASRESQHHLRVVSRIGRRLPAYCTALGKALLAAQPSSETDRLLPATLIAITPKTVTDRRRLDVELSETRLRGYSMEMEQNTVGLACIAMVVPNASKVIDALSCSVPLARLNDEHKAQIVSALGRATKELADQTRRYE